MTQQITNNFGKSAAGRIGNSLLYRELPESQTPWELPITASTQKTAFLADCSESGTPCFNGGFGGLELSLIVDGWELSVICRVMGTPWIQIVGNSEGISAGIDGVEGEGWELPDEPYIYHPSKSK